MADKPPFTARHLRANPLLAGWEECVLFEYFRAKADSRSTLSKWADLNPLSTRPGWGTRILACEGWLLLLGIALWQFNVPPLPAIATWAAGNVGIKIIFWTLLIFHALVWMFWFFYLNRRGKKGGDQTLPDGILEVFVGGGGYRARAATDLWLCGVRGSDLYRVVYLDGCQQHNKHEVPMYLLWLLFPPFLWFLVFAMPYVHEFWYLCIMWAFYTWTQSLNRKTPAAGVLRMSFLCRVIAPRRYPELQSLNQMAGGFAANFLATPFLPSFAMGFAPTVFKDPGLIAATISLAIGISGFLSLSIVNSRRQISTNTYNELMETGDEDFELFMRKTVMEDVDYTPNAPNATDSVAGGIH